MDQNDRETDLNGPVAGPIMLPFKVGWDEVPPCAATWFVVGLCPTLQIADPRNGDYFIAMVRASGFRTCSMT